MVVWVFAGGGESELGKRNKHHSIAENGGLINFLRQNFPHCTFERKTPIRKKPAGKPKPNASYGKTGISLTAQIKKELTIALKNQPNQCTLILIFDDLDCHDVEQQKKKFLQVIKSIDGLVINYQLFQISYDLHKNYRWRGRKPCAPTNCVILLNLCAMTTRISSTRT